jgi:hypothetical protein
MKTCCFMWSSELQSKNVSSICSLVLTFTQKREKKRSLQGLSQGLEDNIRMNLKEVG